ncbi:thermonuclease family protein [Brevibacillus choshinensis]|uniref:Thermonuclease family protein n=1 Tax=Brevibacillus choshinensis TaxID=54911 RepID=A0ABX7FU18_BRECH|nr:thermonuclease family protein [Brevibacillus choshinensis]QRG69739.1 thermonuclease family protein [Brevibacillus choshinensis]
MKRMAICLALLAGLLGACSTPGQPQANGEMEATVQRVVDGDTFELSTGEKVRLIGVDTPETVKPNHPVEPYGKEASDFSKQLLTGQKVTLKFDVEPYDKYKRLLAYMYLQDGTFVNEKLVREGYARIMTIPPNVAQADLFLQAEREARENNRGLWGKSTQTQNPNPTKTPTSTEKPSAADPSQPEGKPIKGNINAKGEKIYHVPGSSSYEQTKAEMWFATEEEAKAAGFRAPKR